MSPAGTNKKHWWQEKKDQHVGVFDVLHDLEDEIGARDAWWNELLSDFLNKPVSGWTPGSRVPMDQQVKSLVSGEPRLVLKPSSNCIHTLGSRVAGQKIKPRFLTNTAGSNAWGLRREARKLEKAVQGEWTRGKVYKKAIPVFYDAGILGKGALKIFPDRGRVKFERVFPGLLAVDPDACLTSPPRTLYQIGYYPAEVLKARFPDAENAKAIDAQIGKVVLSGPQAEPGELNITDIVEVAEAWHLPSGPDAKDGKWVICIDGHTLQSETWKIEVFPFAFFDWTQPILGWYPVGLMEDQRPLQKQLNKMLGRVQDALNLYANAKTYVEKGSIVKGHLKNITGTVVEFNKGSQRPVVEMAPSLSSEVVRTIENLYSKVYEESGVSMLSAASKLPAQVESGIAMRTMQDTETGRHMLLSQEWEDFFVQIAVLTVDCCKMIDEQMRAQEVEEGAEPAAGYVSRYRVSDGFEEIVWADIDLDLQAAELEVQPASYLPHTITGRLGTVMDMLNAGLLGDPSSPDSQAKAFQLIQMPDLDQFTSLETAALEDIDRQVEEMLDNGKAQSPSPFQNLQLAQARVVSALLRARQDGAPDERLALMINYLNSAKKQVDDAAAAEAQMEAEAMAAAQPPPPPGGPGPMEMGPAPEQLEPPAPGMALE